MKNYSLFLSGAADKIKFLIGAVVAIHAKKQYPNEIFASSSGAITALFYVCRRMDEAKLFNFGTKDIFGYNPFSFFGYARAIKNFVAGKDSLWYYSKLRRTIKKFISEKDFQEYLISSRPPVFVNMTSFGPYKERMVNIKDCKTLNEAIEIIIASSSIPFFNGTVSIEINGVKEDMYDGGMTSHIALEKGIPKITSKDMICVFSRPTEFEEEEGSKKKTILKRIPQIIERFLFKISKDDEIIGDFMVKDLDVRVRKVFAPKKLLTGFFKVTSEQNKAFYAMGYQVVQEEIKS